MNSFLISSKDQAKKSDYINSICKEQEVDRFDIEEITPEKTMGISEVRQLQKTLFLKPRRKKKAVIVRADFGITVDAQNAFLKSLEESPESTLIFISVPSLNNILPTIKSRCKNVVLTDEISISIEEAHEALKLIDEIKNGYIPKKLKIAQDVSREKADLLCWIEKIIFALRERAINGNRENLELLKKFQKTYSLIKTTNANSRLVLENLFLDL